MLFVCGSPITGSAETTAIYKCETSGAVEFSQQPCADNPQILHLNVITPRDDKRHSGEQNSINPKPSADSNTIDSYIKMTALKKQLGEHQNKIETYKSQMQKQLSMFNNSFDLQANNLAGAKQSVAIAEQIIATISKFDVLIKNQQMSIDRVTQQIKNLEKTKKSDNANQTGNENIDGFIRKEQLHREIKAASSKVITLSNELKEETLKLEQRMDYQGSSEADTTFHLALSKRIDALSTHYGLLIEIENKKLNRLNDQAIYLP